MTQVIDEHRLSSPFNDRIGLAGFSSMFLWRYDNYLYVLAAVLPITELQTLAHTIDDT